MKQLTMCHTPDHPMAVQQVRNSICPIKLTFMTNNSTSWLWSTVCHLREGNTVQLYLAAVYPCKWGVSTAFWRSLLVFGMQWRTLQMVLLMHGSEPVDLKMAHVALKRCPWIALWKRLWKWYWIGSGWTQIPWRPSQCHGYWRTDGEWGKLHSCYLWIGTPSLPRDQKCASDHL